MGSRLSTGTALIAVLFTLSIALAEVHQAFSDSFKDVSHWFAIPLKFQLTLPWYIHDVGACLRNIIWAFIAVNLSRNAGFRVRGIIFTWLGYCIADLILYLWAYQLYGYEILLFLTGGAVSVLLMIKK